MSKRKTARKAGSAWTDGEIKTLVLAYNLMLKLELEGTKYNKSEIRRWLIGGYLKNRSNSSIEMKLCNVSKFRQLSGLPMIAGYKPYGNAQKRLGEIISEQEGKPVFELNRIGRG
tara:strand:+ start:1960 stop:2304 length:345 start_codon:yes stop_codon:yes gene_type:complete